MALEQAAKVGAIETRQAGPLRNRAARPLHQMHEIAPLEGGRDQALGLHEGQGHENFLLRAGQRDGDGRIGHKGRLVGGKRQFFHAMGLVHGACQTSKTLQGTAIAKLGRQDVAPYSQQGHLSVAVDSRVTSHPPEAKPVQAGTANVSFSRAF